MKEMEMFIGDFMNALVNKERKRLVTSFADG
jgi:hypothetical protein